MSRLALAAISGFLVHVGAPPSHLYAVPVFSFCLFLYALLASERWRDAATTGCVFGLVLMGSHYFWINSFFPWAGPWAIFFWIATVLYQTFFITAFALAVVGLKKRFGTEAGLLSIPLLWTLFDLLSSLGPLGIPEATGHYQFLNPLFRSGASLLGVNYLSFLALSVSSFLVLGVLFWKPRRKGIISLFVFFAFLLAATFGLDFHQRSVLAREDTPTLSIAMIQPPLDPALLNDPDRGNAVFSAFIKETERLLSSHSQPPDVVIWPEMVFPYALNIDGPTRRELFESLRKAGYRGEIVIGGPSEEKGPAYFNTGILFQDGEMRDIYEKERLFPIGEYVPFHRFLSFIRRYLPFKLQLAEYSPGAKVQPLRLSQGKIGVTICLESFYPDLVRRRVLEGADILLNITNDAWFSGSYVEEGHFYFGAMRALENGRPFLQAASSGVTGMANAYGKIIAKSDPRNPGSLWVDVKTHRLKTLFTRIGPWRFGVFLLLTCLYGLVYFVPGSRARS